MQSLEHDPFIQKLHANHRILKRYRLASMVLIIGALFVPMNFGFQPPGDFCAKFSIIGLIFVLTTIAMGVHTTAHANANGIVCPDCQRALTGDANRRTALSGRCGFCDSLLVSADPDTSTRREPASQPAADAEPTTLEFQCTQRRGLFTMSFAVSFVDKCSESTVLHDVVGKFTIYSVTPPFGAEQAQTFHFRREDWENGEVLVFSRNRLWHGYGATITRAEIEIETTLSGARRNLSFDV